MLTFLVSKSLRENWLPIIDSNNIEVVFEFHAHAYKRSFKIKNMSLDNNGTIYLGIILYYIRASSNIFGHLVLYSTTIFLPLLAY
jgi:hypothetical protein